MNPRASVNLVLGLTLLAGCVIADKHETTIVLTPEVKSLAFVGDLVFAPAVEAEAMGETIPEDELIEAIQGSLPPVLVFENIEQVSGARARATMSLDLDLFLEAPISELELIAGVQIRKLTAKDDPKKLVMAIDIEMPGEEVLNELSAYGITLEGKVCVETSYAVEENTFGDRLSVSEAWLSNLTTYCFKIEPEPDLQQRIAFGIDDATS